MNDRLIMKLMLQRMGFLKTVEKQMMLQLFKSVDELPSSRELREILGRDFRSEYERESLIAGAMEDLSALLRYGVALIALEDAAYPARLREIHNPPFLLYCRGELPPLDNVAVSLVGTRKATGSALEKTFALAFDLARSGVCVISGLAEGTDSAAHRGALAGKGYTAAVMGNGIDGIYPHSNRKLAADILDSGGALLSEYPPGTPPLRYNFPERNRIVSAMSEAVVVVESPARSGALITADFALEQGRDVFVLKSEGPSSSAGAGTDRLVEDGAVPIDTAGDLLEELSFRRLERSDGFEIDPLANSETTGIFLAERLMAELEEKEVTRQGVYYSL